MASNSASSDSASSSGGTATRANHANPNQRGGLKVTIEAFNPDTQKWNVYRKRLEQTFVVQDLRDDVKKKAMLLAALGGDVCNILWDLFSPNDPTDDDVTYDDVCDKLANHFMPTKIAVAERFKFYQRKQQSSESVTNFIAALRHLSKDCAFGEFLNEALRDCLVIGLADSRIQAKLLAEAELTLDAAIKMATSLEAVSQQTRQIRAVESTQVNAFHQQSDCWRCGDKHNPNTCRFKDYECFNCKKKGHAAAKCTAPKTNQQSSGEGKPSRRRRQRRQKQGDVKYQNEVPPVVEENLELFHLPHKEASGSSTTRPSRPVKTEFVIDGRRLSMEIDTGAGHF